MGASVTERASSTSYATTRTAQEVASALAQVQDGNFVGISVIERNRGSQGFSPEAKQLLLRAILREEPKIFGQDVSHFVHIGKDDDPDETIVCEDPESEKFAVSLGLPDERHLKPAQITHLS